MATSTVIQEAQAADPAGSEPEPLFQHFSLYRTEIDSATLPGGAVRRFAETVAAYAGGVNAIIQLASDDENRRVAREMSDTVQDLDRALLTAQQVWSLQRFAAAALEDLEDKTERLMQWAYDQHTAEGRARRNVREG